MAIVTLENRLRRVTFGDVPDSATRSVHRMAAAARTDRERWLVAVALGARGHYAAAATLLEELIRGRDAVTASLAASTLASHRRQLGGHAAAMPLDGLALARVRAAPRRESAGDPDGLDAAGARVDAVLGLAADHLALGRPDLARRFVAGVVNADSASGADSAPDADEAGGAIAFSWRTRVRARWVGAEAALASGDAAAALRSAERAPAHADSERPRALGGAVRHRAKSELVLAAALTAGGGESERRRAAGLVGSALGVIDARGLASLAWPARLLAADLAGTGHLAGTGDAAAGGGGGDRGDDPSAAERAEEHRMRATREVRALLRRVDPVGRRLAVSSPWVPV